MKKIYLVQVNNRYGENVYLPYSVGMLWAYAQTQPSVVENWELGGFIYLKEPIEQAVDRLVDPDVVGMSCYIWNWRWSLAFATEVKKRWSRCKIVAGGVQVQDESPATLNTNPQLDFGIYGEGEAAFAELLEELAKTEPDFASVGSLIWRDVDGVRVNERRRFVDLEALRSPYLDDVFSSILNDGWRWQVAQETNRGCPYKCSFCAWGQAALDKIRPIPMERVLEEIAWFSEHKSPYIDNCDANFGVLKRDRDIVQALIEIKAATGYPQRFRTSWAKNSNDKVFDMARDLANADLLKAVTLSMQSMDDRVLGLVKRKNIRYDNLSNLLVRYEEEGIPTYTEIIMGLPGETFSSYVEGIDRVLEAGQHDGLFCYPCLILPNTEMSTSSYMNEHGLVTVEMRAMLAHGVPAKDVVEETQTVVVATKTMSHEDWKNAYYFSWIVQVMHVLGLLQHVAKESRKKGISFRKFYEEVLVWVISAPETIAGTEYLRIRDLLERVLVGGSWDLVDEHFGEISWPPDEFCFLHVVCKKDLFFEEVASLLRRFVSDEIIEEQRRLIVSPEPGREEEYARDAVWYGRKGAGANRRKVRAA